jgi:hypothetical protein
MIFVMTFSFLEIGGCFKIEFDGLYRANITAEISSMTIFIYSIYALVKGANLSESMLINKIVIITILELIISWKYFLTNS